MPTAALRPAADLIELGLVDLLGVLLEVRLRELAHLSHGAEHLRAIVVVNVAHYAVEELSLIHISEPTRLALI
eukprot:8803367-Alexandrium_andersonii.AAC.1